MKKYIVTKAFSVLEKILLIPEDEIYAEPRLFMILVYSIKTRKLIGKVSKVEFDKCTKVFRKLKVRNEMISEGELSFNKTKNTPRTMDVVPCDLVMGKVIVLEEPHRDDYDMYDDTVFLIDMEKYQQAKERCLLKGFVVKSGFHNEYSFIYDKN